MKIKGNVREIWDFVVFLYHIADEAERDVCKKQRAADYAMKSLEEQQKNLEESIRQLEKHQQTTEEWEETYRHNRILLRKLEEEMDRLAVYSESQKLVKKQKLFRRQLFRSAHQLEKIIEYLEELEFDTAYKEYEKNDQAEEDDRFHKMQLRGITFHYSREDFNFDQMDASGKTNLERMQKGRVPIGKDGFYVELHHLIQREKGEIAEISGKVHRENHKLLHINPSSIPSGINRAAFRKLRKAYWKRRSDLEIRRRTKL